MHFLIDIWINFCIVEFHETDSLLVPAKIALLLSSGVAYLVHNSELHSDVLCILHMGEVGLANRLLGLPWYIFHFSKYSHRDEQSDLLMSSVAQRNSSRYSCGLLANYLKSWMRCRISKCRLKYDVVISQHMRFVWSLRKNIALYLNSFKPRHEEKNSRWFERNLSQTVRDVVFGNSKRFGCLIMEFTFKRSLVFPNFPLDHSCSCGFLTRHIAHVILVDHTSNMLYPVDESDKIS